MLWIAINGCFSAFSSADRSAQTRAVICSRSISRRFRRPQLATCSFWRTSVSPPHFAECGYQRRWASPPHLRFWRRLAPRRFERSCKSSRGQLTPPHDTDRIYQRTCDPTPVKSVANFATVVSPPSPGRRRSCTRFDCAIVGISRSRD